MAKYRKIPVVIEAYQVLDDDETTRETPQFIIKGLLSGDIKLITGPHRQQFSVKSREGIVTGELGDWIIKGVEGELYICKDSVFKKTYEYVPLAVKDKE